jgi:hypothetical protein
MGIGIRKTRKLLDYQLNDFLELKLKESERKLISKVKQAILRSPYFEGSSLYEFPAIGTKKVCFVLSNGFSEKLRTLCFMNSDGSFKEIELR